MQEPDNELLYTYNREMHYGFKDGKYVRNIDYQNPGNQQIILQSWEVAEERLEEVRQKVIRGEVSPIAFYMEKNLMEIPMLAAYTGFFRFRIKRHLNPKRFAKLKPEVLDKYAEVFMISRDELINIPQK